MSLAKKLKGVMEKVTYIQKGGMNTFHGYKYAGEAQVLDEIHKALVGEGVAFTAGATEIIPPTKESDGVAHVKMLFTFRDTESEEIIECPFWGSGQDISKAGKMGDKGTYKAITGATKYFLMKTFLIPTGDDPEGDRKQDETNATETKAPEDEEKDKKTGTEILATLKGWLPEVQKKNKLKGEKLVKFLADPLEHTTDNVHNMYLQVKGFLKK